MIFDLVSGLIFNGIYSLLDKVPVVSAQTGFEPILKFFDIVCSVLYFFPWAGILPILGIILAFQAYRIAMSVLKTIVEFIPFM